MDFLCLINLFFFVFLTIYYPIYISKSLKLKLLNPITILVVVTMPIALFKAFFGPAYLLNDGFFTLVSYFFLFIIFNFRFYKLDFISQNRLSISPGWCWRILCFRFTIPFHFIFHIVTFFEKEQKYLSFFNCIYLFCLVLRFKTYYVKFLHLYDYCSLVQKCR